MFVPIWAQTVFTYFDFRLTRADRLNNGDGTASFLLYPNAVGDTENRFRVSNFKSKLIFMANFYCEYCGSKSSSVASLTGGSCGRHPSGSHKGKHKLYEGGEKTKYTCKYCGTSSSSLSSLTGGSCGRHPAGSHKGKHAPAL